MMTSPRATHLRPMFYLGFLAHPAKKQLRQPSSPKPLPHQPQASRLATGSLFPLSPSQRLFEVIPKPILLRSRRTLASRRSPLLELPVSRFAPRPEFRNAEIVLRTISKSRGRQRTLAPLRYWIPLLALPRSFVQGKRSPPRRNRNPAAFYCCHHPTIR